MSLKTTNTLKTSSRIPSIRQSFNKMYITRHISGILRNIGSPKDPFQSHSFQNTDLSQIVKTKDTLNFDTSNYNRRIKNPDASTEIKTFEATQSTYRDMNFLSCNISKIDIISNIEKIEYEFDKNWDDSFQRMHESTPRQDSNKSIEMNSKSGEKDSRTASQVKQAELLNDYMQKYDIKRITKKHFSTLFKEKNSQKKRPNSIISQLREIEDYEGPQMYRSETYRFLAKTSHLENKFLQSYPFYQKISPSLDFGVDFIEAFSGKNEVTEELIKPYSECVEGEMARFSNKGIFDFQYYIAISRVLMPKEQQNNLSPTKKTKKKDENGTEIVMKFDSISDEDEDQPPQTIFFPSGLNAKYSQGPEKVNTKKNFSCQVNIERTNRKQLSEEDFLKKINELKSMDIISQANNKENTDLYINEVESIIDIIFELQPKMGHFKNLVFEKKVLTLIKHIDQFKNVYLGNLYFPQIIKFILLKIKDLKLYQDKIKQQGKGAKKEGKDRRVRGGTVFRRGSIIKREYEEKNHPVFKDSLSFIDTHYERLKTVKLAPKSVETSKKKLITRKSKESKEGQKNALAINVIGKRMKEKKRYSLQESMINSSLRKQSRR